MQNGIPIEVEITGYYAMFADPVMRPGGEKCSYQVPTYEAIKGMLKSIYWKPTFTYIVEAVRILNPIRFTSKGVRLPRWTGGNDLATYMYLTDVRYQVKARLVWNENRPEFAQDRCTQKHKEMFERALAKGGRYDVFLGTRECQAYVKPCVFGEGQGCYDDLEHFEIGIQFHGIIYPDEGYDAKTRKQMTVCYWRPVMENGVIRFPEPKDCEIQHKIRNMTPKVFEQKGDAAWGS